MPEEPTEVLPLLDAAIREDPLRERSRELLMLALYRSGRHAEALRTYERLRVLLSEELGLDPSPPLQRMQERVLLHDPSLLPAAEAAAEAAVDARNPYKGLRPFGEDDAADFFGRDALTEAVLDRLRAGARLVALVGPSGSGKSSVLAAGVVPRLREGALPGSDGWVIASLVPGARPMEDIEAVVSKATELPVGLADLLDGPGGNAGATLPTMPHGGRLVIVMDQFEELFTVTEESVRRRFLQGLAAAVSRPGRAGHRASDAARRLLRSTAVTSRVRGDLRPGRDERPADDRGGARVGRHGAGKAGRRNGGARPARPARRRKRRTSRERCRSSSTR